MLVVDLLHEFELGVWKALFIHLLRILETVCTLFRYNSHLFITHGLIVTAKLQLLVGIRFEGSVPMFLN
jgi:hypothetical protein